MKPRDVRVRALIVSMVGVILFALGNGVAWAQVPAMRSFGLGLTNYPGGTLKVVYEIWQAGRDTPHIYTLEVIQRGDRYDVIETTTMIGVIVGNVAMGFGRSGAAAAAGTRFEGTRGGNIDLSPLQVLEEKGIIVQPNQNYYLPDGARLVTEAASKIAGVDVVVGMYLHPGFPGQRVQMAFTAPGISDLLPFPPLTLTEADGKMRSKVLLLEFSHKP